MSQVSTMPTKRTKTAAKSQRKVSGRAKTSVGSSGSTPSTNRAARPKGSSAKATIRKRTPVTSKPASPEAAEIASRPVATNVRGLVSYKERVRKAMSLAQILFDAKTDWPSYFREVLGLTGIVERLFSDEAEMARFKASKEHATIQEYLAILVKGRSDANREEPGRVITVRLPDSLHASLKTAARKREMSLNELCINRLLQEEVAPK